MTSQNIDLSSWDILYSYFRLEILFHISDLTENKIYVYFIYLV
jgi:hypothetical protein